MRKIGLTCCDANAIAGQLYSQDRTITGVVKMKAGPRSSGLQCESKEPKVVQQQTTRVISYSAKAGDVSAYNSCSVDPAEFTVGASDAVALLLRNKIATGTEVVVTALGIKRQDKALGYGVSKVDPIAFCKNQNQMF
jgi:hypothetical protein